MSKGYNSQQTTRGMSVISNINDDATGNGNVVEDSSFKMDVGRTAQVGRQQGHLRQDGGRQGQGGGDGGGGTARCPPRKVTFCQLPCTQESQTSEEDIVTTYLNESDVKRGTSELVDMET